MAQHMADRFVAGVGPISRLMASANGLNPTIPRFSPDSYRETIGINNHYREEGTIPPCRG
jgi:hypothetical protein